MSTATRSSFHNALLDTLILVQVQTTKIKSMGLKLTSYKNEIIVMRQLLSGDDLDESSN